MKKLIIYGINHQAEQLYIYLQQREDVKVDAFIVDQDYKKKDSLLGLPVSVFEEATRLYPPDEYQIVLSFGYKNMVKNRQQKFELCKNKGYTIYTFVSEDAKVYSGEVGEGSIIYPNAFVAPFVKIGKGCFLENSVSVAHHSVVGDFCFLAPRATVCGDTKIGTNCFLGANCTVAGSLHLSSRTLVSAGAFLKRNTDEGSVCFPGKSTVLNNRIPEDFI